MVFFLHTPKCAGTSFYEYVKRNHSSYLKPKLATDSTEVSGLEVTHNNTAIRLPGGYEDAALMAKKIIELDRATQSKISFIGGHVGFGFHEFIQTEVDYISFVRDPRSRVISDFQEHCKKGRHFYKDLARNGFQINKYLELLIEHNLDNFFTRQLSGTFDFYLSDRKNISNSEIVNALENSKMVDFFPVTDYNEAMYYFKLQYGWERLYFKKKNVAIKTNLPIDYNHNLMNEVTKFDYQLLENIKFKRLPTLNWWQRLMVSFG